MCIEPFENVCILGDFNDRNQTCVDSPSFKRWKELGRLMLESGVRFFSKDGITFRKNLVTERSVLDLSVDPITVTREVSCATYVSQGNMRHKHWGITNIRDQVPDNNGVEFVGTDICMMDSAFNFEYEEFEKYLVDKK